jgi:hypothetical protein
MATIAIGERVGHLYHRREGDQDHFVYRAATSVKVELGLGRWGMRDHSWVSYAAWVFSPFGLVDSRSFWAEGGWDC